MVTGSLIFLETHLVPVLMPFNGVNPFSVVITDNASIHHVDSAVTAIQNTGARIIFFATIFSRS